MMSVNAVIINSKENTLTSINFSSEKLNFLEPSSNDNDASLSLNEDEDEDYELEDGENNVLLKSKRGLTTTDPYLINKNHSNFSSSSSLASSSNSLIQNNNELYLDAQEFNDEINLFTDNKVQNKVADINQTQSNTSNKNDNLTIKKVDSYVELSLKRTSMAPCLNSNKNKYTKRYEYDSLAGVMGAYSSKKLLNSMSRSISKSNISKSSASFASNCLSSSSITPLSSTSFSSLFVNTTANLFANENRLISIELSNPVKKMKISQFHDNVKMETDSNLQSTLNNKSTKTPSKLKSLHLKFNRKVKTSSKKYNQTNNSSNNNAIALNKNLKTSKISTNPNLNAPSSYANKFLKLNNDLNFNFSKSYISKKSKKNATATAVRASLSNLSNFSSLANSTNMIPIGRKLKCLLVGDSRVGKTALMFLFLKRIFQSEYQPTIVDDYEVKIKYNNESYTLSLFDTAGQEDWDTLRKMAYPETDVVILCFSVARPDSLENITSKWMPELNKLIPTAQIVLVGTQIDLRDNFSSNTNIPSNKNDDLFGKNRVRYVSTKEGEEAKQRIKAFKYVECSALKQLNVNEVFNTCVESYISFNQKVEPPCSCFQSFFKRFRFTDWLRRFSFRRRNSSNKSSKPKQEKYSSKNEL